MANSSKPTDVSGGKSDRGAVGVAERETGPSGKGRIPGSGGDGSGNGPRPGPGDGAADRRGGGLGSSGRSSFFDIYKPGQGHYTRLGTAVGGGVLILGGGDFLVGNLIFDSEGQWTLWLQYGIPALLVVALGLALFWVTGVNRGTCDFFIATEGEMKKVSWSTRNELIGSTKVVIACTLLLGFLLAVVDLVFIRFFQLINVLRSGT